MDNVGVGKKLISGFLIVALLCMVCSGVGLYSVTQYKTLMSYSTDILMEGYSALLHLAANLGDSRQHNYEGFLYPDEIDENIQDEKALYDDAIATADRVANLTEIMAELSAQFKTRYTKAYKSQTEMFNMVAAGTFDFDNPEHKVLLANLDDDWDAIQSLIQDSIVTLNNYKALLLENEEKLNRISAVLLILVSLSSLVVALLIAFLNVRSILNPTKEVAGILESMSKTGDLRVNISDALRTRRDEFGEMGRSFADAMNMMQSNVQILDQVAHGDLTVDIKIRSNDDAMGIAMRDMVAQMNDLFASITSFSEQIASGSRQISDGSQSLAQGATEQASAIEELSASIAHISTQTADTSKRVNEASELASGIRANAEQSNRKMRQLVEAVQEIDAASNSISKIIQVIDDIAFQTNLLALNASVEAAHAGIHGAGFAVVADEVKTLATRSQTAAKDTAQLIENSIGKAVEGVTIARDAEEALGDIVNGINSAASIISRIAEAAADEADALMQINSGVEQVSQAVQVNSATSQEAASASAELTEIAQNLQLMMGAFRLGNDALPSGAPRQRKGIPAPAANAGARSAAGFGKY